MVIAEPPWLHAWAQGFAVLLLLELIVLLLIVTALMFALMYGSNWLRTHVIPVLNATVPRARQALTIANVGTERVVRGVAEVYGIRRAVETGLRVIVRGGRPTLAALESRGATPAEIASPSASGAAPGETRPATVAAGEGGAGVPEAGAQASRQERPRTGRAQRAGERTTPGPDLDSMAPDVG